MTNLDSRRLNSAFWALRIGLVALIVPPGMVMESPSRGSAEARPVLKGFDRPIAAHAAGMLEEGRQTFRYDTFGD
ncbi:MAG TPA: hypothetical protein VE398_09255, partial [Acidobacteriota bacterium]|nr:hypothetical protein [Acidobacteriota bacterium]